MEEMGEVKKTVEKIVYTMVCTHTHTQFAHTALKLDQRKEILSG